MNPRTFVLTVDRHIQRFDDTAAHLDEMGIKWERFNGMDNQVCRLLPVDTFDLDRAGEKIGSKHIAATLSHYMVWKVMEYQKDDAFWVLEYDVRMEPDWQKQYDYAMEFMPDDWDIIFLGSCCCKGRPTQRIEGFTKGSVEPEETNIYEVKYPLCGHAIMYRKKALPTLLREHQKIAMPLDIALYHYSLPKLKVFTILPPIVVQAGPALPP